MDRNLYQQCGGAHVFRIMVIRLITVFFFFSVYGICLGVCVFPCAWLFPSRFLHTRCNVCVRMIICVRVCSFFPSNIKCVVHCSAPPRMLHRECGIKEEGVEIKRLKKKKDFTKYKFRISGSGGFPNSKLSGGKRIPFFHPALTMQHPARFSLYVYLFTCI